MAYRYMVVRNTYLDGDYNKTSFGIAVAEECNGNTVVLESFSDVSPNMECMEQLSDYCNRLQLDPVQLPEVIEDFLSAI